MKTDQNPTEPEKFICLYQLFSPDTNSYFSSMFLPVPPHLTVFFIFEAFNVS